MSTPAITEVVEPVPPARKRGEGLLWLLNGRLALGLTLIAILGVGSFVLPIFCPVDPSVQAGEQPRDTHVRIGVTERAEGAVARGRHDAGAEGLTVADER